MSRRNAKISVPAAYLTPLWKIMSRNWLMKLFCLVMAVIVWQSVRESTSFEVVEADIPVTDTAGEGLAVSSGSACSSETPRPSHVLLAIGLTEDEARASLRFGVSRFTTEEEVDRAAEVIADGVRRLREG